MYEAELDTLKDFQKRLNELRACLNVDTLKEHIADLEAEMGVQGFWDDPEKAQGVVKKLKGYKNTVSMPDELHREIDDALVLVEMSQEENDEGLAAEITKTVADVEAKLHKLELNSLFNDPRDEKD